MRSYPERRSLGELGQIVSGATPRTDVKAYWDGEIPWITPADLTNHEGVFFRGKLRNITKAGFASCSTQLLPVGSILFSSRAPIGHCAVTSFPLCTNQGFKSVIPGSGLEPVYGYFALKFCTPQIIARGRGATFAEVNKEIMEEVEIPWYPLAEQQRIAAVLAKADRLRRLRRQALALSDTYLQSVFLAMFGNYLDSRHPHARMGELVQITGGGTPSRAVARYFEGAIPWLTAKDMRGDFIFDTEEHITEEAIAKSATKLVPAGSLLIVIKSKVLMRRLPLAVAQRPLCHGQDIKSIQCSERVDPLFLLHVIRYNEPKLLVQARGANTEGLTLPMLEEIPVPDVPLSHQRRFASTVRTHERLRAQQREAARQAEHLLATLLVGAFGGEEVVSGQWSVVREEGEQLRLWGE